MVINPKRISTTNKQQLTTIRKSMFVKTYAGAVEGIEATIVTVEVSAGGTVLDDKKNFYFMVGLPDKAVSEGWQRIEAAFRNCRLSIDRVKLVVNLAPADLRKEGSSYDLPIALGIYAASNSYHFPELERDRKSVV